jgi:hypothetical protein
MPQAGRLQALILIRSLEFFSLPNPSSHTIALGLAQPLTAMNIRNLPGGG